MSESKAWKFTDIRTEADWVEFTNTINKACKKNERKLKKALDLLQNSLDLFTHPVSCNAHHSDKYRCRCGFTKYKKEVEKLLGHK